MSNIYVIGVDGLHNNGKTTQLKLLKTNLESLGFFTVIRRGDGSRKGEGLEEFDPSSTWWLENRPRILEAGFEGRASHDAATEASDRLNRELYLTKNWWMEREMKKRGLSNGIILQDRGLVSRMFVYRREEPQASFDDIRYFSNRDTKVEVVLPDVIFLLHSPVEVLLSRNPSRTDDSSKKEFNKTVLGNYYDDFERNLATLPDEIKRITRIVNSSGTINEVQEELLRQTLQFIHDKKFGVEGNITPGIERE